MSLRSASCRVAIAGLACVLATACGSVITRAHGTPASTITASTVRRTVPLSRRVHDATDRPVHAVKGPVTTIGDSVMIDAPRPRWRSTLPAVTIDAVVNRSALPGPTTCLALAQSGRLGSSIVIGLGTNGGVGKASVIDEMLRITASSSVVMVTSYCGYCSWTSAGNAIVRSTCTGQRNCFVADWDALRTRGIQHGSRATTCTWPSVGMACTLAADLVRTRLSA